MCLQHLLDFFLDKENPKKTNKEKIRSKCAASNFLDANKYIGHDSNQLDRKYNFRMNASKKKQRSAWENNENNLINSNLRNNGNEDKFWGRWLIFIGLTAFYSSSIWLDFELHCNNKRGKSLFHF